MPYNISRDINFFVDAPYNYDLFHFSNANGKISAVTVDMEAKILQGEDIYMLQKLQELPIHVLSARRCFKVAAKWGLSRFFHLQSE